MISSWWGYWNISTFEKDSKGVRIVFIFLRDELNTPIYFCCATLGLQIRASVITNKLRIVNYELRNWID